MPRGDKSSYSDKQKRKAVHIEESYAARGVPEQEAEARAWATVNKQSGGGERSGAGQHTPAGAKRAARQDSAQRAARSRQKDAGASSPRTAHEGCDLDRLSRSELMHEAQKRQIPGRSKMRKAELIQALS